MPLVECVPNFSEGRDESVIAAIQTAIVGTDGAHVLDVSSDASHNRTVVTFVASLGAAVPAALAAMRVARDRIDLNTHHGEHPRIGATDVVPFIPLEGATMIDCIALAKELARRAYKELGIPVYLYERAATVPQRENLADVRRGEFEGLRDEVKTNAARRPDFGEAALHPTAGATAVGARPFLVAYNVYLGDKSNIAVAKAVAKAVRGSSGGLRYVKGLGLEVDGQAQVSMNLVDTDSTPLHRVFEFVRNEAAAYGVQPTWSEIVGLVPERVLLDAGARHVNLRGFSNSMLLEHKVREAVAGGEALDAFVGRVAAPVPTPGGGSVAALAGAMGAALAGMVAGLTTGKKKYAAVESEMQQISVAASELRHKLQSLVQLDASAYEKVRTAYAMPKEPADAATARDAAIRDALMNATRVPLDTAMMAAEVAELAASVAERGNTNAASDAAVAGFMADAACKGALLNVKINVASFDASVASVGAHMLSQATDAVAHASAASARAHRAAEASIAASASA